MEEIDATQPEVDSVSPLTDVVQHLLVPDRSGRPSILLPVSRKGGDGEAEFPSNSIGRQVDPVTGSMDNLDVPLPFFIPGHLKEELPDLRLELLIAPVSVTRNDHAIHRSISLLSKKGNQILVAQQRELFEPLELLPESRVWPDAGSSRLQIIEGLLGGELSCPDEVADEDGRRTAHSLPAVDEDVLLLLDRLLDQGEGPEDRRNEIGSRSVGQIDHGLIDPGREERGRLILLSLSCEPDHSSDLMLTQDLLSSSLDRPQIEIVVDLIDRNRLKCLELLVGEPGIGRRHH